MTLPQRAASRVTLPFSLGVCLLSLAACAGTQSPVSGEHLIETDLQLDQSMVTDNDRDAIALLSLDALAAPQTNVPADVSLVIDASGSMEGSHWEHAQMAAHRVVDALRPGDALTIIRYADRASLLLERAEMPTDRDRAHMLIDEMTPEGQTCISCGLQMAYDVYAAAPARALRRAVLISDGRPNVGITDSHSLAAFTSAMKVQQNIRTDTLGLGRLHDADTLLAMAESSSSQYTFVSSPDDLPLAVASIVDELHQTTVVGVEVVFVPGDGVTWGNVPQVGARYEAQNLIVPIGELSVDQSREFAIGLHLPAGAIGRAVRAQVRFTDLDGKEYEVVSDAYVGRTPDPVAAAATSNLTVIRAYALVASAATMEDATIAYDQGDLAAAAAYIEEGQSYLGGLRGAPDAVLEAESLRIEAFSDEIMGGTLSEDESRERRMRERGRSRDRRRGAAPQALHE
jgi:hypothetical protein